jgi:hypothetical protein
MAQGALELLARSRRAPFENSDHIANAIAWWYVDEVLAWGEPYLAA